MNINTQFYDTILYEVEDNIATLTINRTDKLNALNEQVFVDLKHCLSNIDSSVRGLIITGQGDKAFIAGADIAAMNKLNSEEAVEFSKVGQDATLRLENLPIPVIAAVNGYALGGGCEIAMGADFIYATDNAMFALPEVTLGLIPGFGGTPRLASLIGRNAAKEIIFTGRSIKIDEAKKLGLVLKSFETKEQLLAAAKETLMKVSANSSISITETKRVMENCIGLSLQECFDLESSAFGRLFENSDAHEGTLAFLEKRKANFSEP